MGPVKRGCTAPMFHCAYVSYYMGKGRPFPSMLAFSRPADLPPPQHTSTWYSRLGPNVPPWLSSEHCQYSKGITRILYRFLRTFSERLKSIHPIHMASYRYWSPASHVCSPGAVEQTQEADVALHALASIVQVHTLLSSSEIQGVQSIRAVWPATRLISMPWGHAWMVLKLVPAGWPVHRRLSLYSSCLALWPYGNLHVWRAQAVKDCIRCRGHRPQGLPLMVNCWPLV